MAFLQTRSAAPLGARLLCCKKLGEGEVQGACHLQGAFITGNGLNGASNGLDEARVIRGSHGLVGASGGTRLVRAGEHVPSEALRGLHGHHVSAPGRARDEARGVHGLERVRDGQDRDDGTSTAAHRVDDARAHLRGCQGTSRVMHEDNRVRIAVPEGSQASHTSFIPA